jgi:hypothetical protein
MDVLRRVIRRRGGNSLLGSATPAGPAPCPDTRSSISTRADGSATSADRSGIRVVARASGRRLQIRRIFGSRPAEFWARGGAVPGCPKPPDTESRDLRNLTTYVIYMYVLINMRYGTTTYATQRGIRVSTPPHPFHSSAPRPPLPSRKRPDRLSVKAITGRENVMLWIDDGSVRTSEDHRHNTGT